MSDLAWMFVAFSAVAIGLGTYLVWLGARRRRLERRREELSSSNRSDSSH
jgi:CcmD family protein